MRIAEESKQHLRVLPHPDIGALRDALRPLLDDLPAVTSTLPGVLTMRPGCRGLLIRVSRCSRSAWSLVRQGQ